MTERLLSTISFLPCWPSLRSAPETISHGVGESKLPLSGLGEGVLSRLTEVGAARVVELRATQAIRRGEAGIFILTRLGLGTVDNGDWRVDIDYKRELVVR